MLFNDQEMASIEQLKLVISNTSLLASVMVEQPINQVAISSIETKSKFESWIVPVENAAQMLGSTLIGGFQLSHTVVKLDSHLTQIFCQKNCIICIL